MALARKPTPQASADVDALIERGGSVRSDARKRADTTAVPLRLPRDLLARIDRAVDAQPLKTPRNTWILQALLERLERDGID